MSLFSAVRAALGGALPGIPDQGGVTAMLKVGGGSGVARNVAVGLAVHLTPRCRLPSTGAPPRQHHQPAWLPPSFPSTVQGAMGTAQAVMAPLKTGLTSLHASLDKQYAALNEQLEVVLAAAEAEYCTPATFTPSA